MTKRKTVKIDDMKMIVNSVLLNMGGDDAGSIRYRKGMMVLLEEFLQQTGNYNGFKYLTKNEVPFGNKPGININGKNLILEDFDMRFADTDSTRVAYL